MQQIGMKKQTPARFYFHGGIGRHNLAGRCKHE